jgi:hypothetical protein
MFNSINTDVMQFSELANNFSLIPLNGKVPFEKGWQQWCSTKHEFNEADFEGHNAGVCCGPASGVIVLDIDDPDAFEALIKGNGFEIPGTYTVRTGSGKLHYYFTYPATGDEIGNRSLKHPVYSRSTIFDIRGMGGQVVAPGSIHPDTGKAYKVEKDLPVAPIPDWLMGFITTGSIDTGCLWSIPLPEPQDREFIESLKVSPDIQQMILNGKPKGERSEAGMTVMLALMGARYDHNTIRFIFDHYPIGDKAREKGKAWFNGEIKRAENHINKEKGIVQTVNTVAAGAVNTDQDNPIAAVIEQLNKKHAVVMVGGSCLILNEVEDPVFKRQDISFSRVSDFKNFYNPQKVPVSNRGGTSQKGIADVWLDSSDRRQYKGIIFNPAGDIKGYYNLYKGLALEPKQGDWSLMQNHILEVICGGDVNIYKWLISWMADLVQNPGGDKPGTALVIRGKQGTGKGIFLSNFGKIFGSNFLHITNQNQLTGKFNNHLTNALFVFVDEGFWAGDKSVEGIIKAMITEEQFMVEPKGKDAFPVKNYIRLAIASNNDWIVPAGLEERRFLVLDASDIHMQDQEYFKRLFDQMDNGGREAMLYDLLNHDSSDVNLRTIPKTAALMDQIILSMTSVQKFWHEKLTEGSLGDYNEWTEPIEIKELYKDYLEYTKNTGGRYPSNASQFGKELHEVCPEVVTERTGPQRKRHYCFPSLEVCRKALEDVVKCPLKWE